MRKDVEAGSRTGIIPRIEVQAVPPPEPAEPLMLPEEDPSGVSGVFILADIPHAGEGEDRAKHRDDDALGSAYHAPAAR